MHFNFRSKSNIIRLAFILLLILLILLTLEIHNNKWRHELENALNYYKPIQIYRPDLAVDSTGTLPYISGSNLVFISNFVYDFKVKNVKQVENNGDIIFVCTDLIDKFFKQIYPKIEKKFILITHNSDYSTNLTHSKYLNENKLIVWFGQNPGFSHSKHKPIPIGFENTIWNPKKIQFIRNLKYFIPWKKKKYLLYINFEPNTNPGARRCLIEMFKSFDNVLIEHKVDYKTYMSHIGDSKFVLCPKGNGIDTHRFYETILMESIPIVENSTLYPIFIRTTSLILQKYSDLRVEMLYEPEKYINSMEFSKNVLFMETWLNEINKFKSEI